MKVNMQTSSIAIAITLVLSACGGGGGSTPPAVVTENKIVQCSENKTTSLKKDDKITALKDATEIRLTHMQDGNKSACVISGDAKIEI